MMHKIDFENDGSGAYVTFHGRLTGEDVYEGIYATYQQDPMHLLRYQIDDFSDVERIDSSTDDIRRIAMLDYEIAPLKGKQLIAIVGSDAVLQQRDYIYKIYAAAWPKFVAETFRTVSEARNWINTSS